MEESCSLSNLFKEEITELLSFLELHIFYVYLFPYTPVPYLYPV